MKTALIHYWLTNVRGGEKVLSAIAALYPDASIYTHAYQPCNMGGLFDGRDVRETFIAHLPFGRKHPQAYLPLMPRALRSLDLAEYDLVISSESGPAKGVRKRTGQRHVCYCHTPMRYLWDMHEEYYRNASLPGKMAMRLFTPALRRADIASAEAVDLFVANSAFVRERIRRIYRRDAEVVHPPVDVEMFRPAKGETSSRGFFLCAGQLVPYKRADVAIEACVRMNLPLVVAGAGPQEKALRKRYAHCPNVVFKGRVDDASLRELYINARALLFPGVEDFGIMPVEAQAAGTPVVAFGAGGALETVLPGKTGVFFHEQTPSALCAVLEEFASQSYSPSACIANARRFSMQEFSKAFASVLEKPSGCTGGKDLV
ncbi:MAG: glycosyltransferase [Kiritimatiellae bacterium]|nr:glycosyltransferase [Kiritimatiellia bacterium]